MWVSRQQWESLVKRVERLEMDNKYSHHFDVYRYYEQSGRFASYGGYGYSEPQRISVKDVVQRILLKLGMQLKYVEGAPARVDVCDAAPHADQPQEK